MRRLENEDEEKVLGSLGQRRRLLLPLRQDRLTGQTKLKRFKTDAQAEAELKEKLEEKLGQGFSEGDAKEKASGDDALANPELEASILANPDDDETTSSTPTG